jgi:hypothetical protein
MSNAQNPGDFEQSNPLSSVLPDLTQVFQQPQMSAATAQGTKASGPTAPQTSGDSSSDSSVMGWIESHLYNGSVLLVGVILFLIGLFLAVMSTKAGGKMIDVATTAATAVA